MTEGRPSGHAMGALGRGPGGPPLSGQAEAAYERCVANRRSSSQAKVGAGDDNGARISKALEGQKRRGRFHKPHDLRFA
jgi:hypothetical protein